MPCDEFHFEFILQIIRSDTTIKHLPTKNNNQFLSCKMLWCLLFITLLLSNANAFGNGNMKIVKNQPGATVRN